MGYDKVNNSTSVTKVAAGYQSGLTSKPLSVHWDNEGEKHDSNQKNDSASFSEMMRRRRRDQERREQTPLEIEIEKKMDLIAQNNDTIRRRARFLTGYGGPRAIPSALGLPVDFAAEKLDSAGFKVRGVAREYNGRIPAGHVISQSPEPGSMVPRESGVRLIISRGPMPQKKRFGLF